MADIESLKSYFMKLQRNINKADFNLFGKTYVKANNIDDVFCCILALLPEAFTKFARRGATQDNYPAAASYGRLTKILSKKALLLPDYYVFNKHEAMVLIQGIIKNLSRELEQLES